MSYYASHRPRSSCPEADYYEPSNGRIHARSGSASARSYPHGHHPNETPSEMPAPDNISTIKAFSAKSLASGSLYPPATAACGVMGSSWFGMNLGNAAEEENGNNHNNSTFGCRKGDYQIQDLILKLSNVPLIKSTTCKTCQTDEVTEFSDEENSPAVALHYSNMGNGELSSTKNSLQVSYPPYGRPEQVASYFQQHFTPDVEVTRATPTQQSTRKENRNRKKHASRNRNASGKQSNGKTPRYVCAERYHESQDDEISSLAATAANEILDCMNANAMMTSTPSFLLPYSAKNQSRQPQRTNSIVASCMAPTIMDVPKTTTTMPGKSLLRASFPSSTTENANVCLPNMDGSYNNADADGSNGISTSSLLCGQSGQEIVVSSTRTFSVQYKVQREIQYWMNRLDQTEQYQKRIFSNGNSCTRKTADLHFNLGHAYMKHALYDLAIEHFTIAQTQWQNIHKSQYHVTVARALDAKGLALLRQAQPPSSSSKHPAQTKMPDPIVLSKAQQVLQQAFAIRFHHLGVWHVDTVETYNKLASVHLHMGELREACHAYHQVFLVRRAIFGGRHPSVAISAHSLANVYYKLQMKQESFKWYQMALRIYEEDLQLSRSHPTVAKLLKDRSRLDGSF